MKKFTVVTFLTYCLLFLTRPCVAQAYRTNTLSASVGVEALFPESKLAVTNKTGVGLTFKGEYIFSTHASTTVNGGYYSMEGRTRLNIKNQNISAIPIKVGARYYLASYYAAGEVGKIFLMGDNSRSGFVYSFGLGDKLNVGNNIFDISLRHEGWTAKGISRGFIGLRVAYEFAINKKEATILPVL